MQTAKQEHEKEVHLQLIKRSLWPHSNVKKQKGEVDIKVLKAFQAADHRSTTMDADS